MPFARPTRPVFLKFKGLIGLILRARFGVSSTRAVPSKSFC